MASEELHLTKAAISQSITSLEASLGKKLFLRSGNKLKPTPEAVKFHTDLVPFQANINHALENLVGGSRKIEGELCIGAYLEFAKSQMMPVIEKFLKDFDKASLRFRFESPSRLDQLLRDQRIDLSLSIFPHQGSKSIRSTELLKVELVLIAPQGLVRNPSDSSEIKKLPLIDYYSGHILFKRWWNHYFEKAQYEPKVRVYAATAELVAKMVSRGLGVGVVPRYVAEPYIKTQKVEVVAPNSDLLHDYIWLNEWIEANPRPLQKEFVQRLKSKFAGKV